VQPFDPREAFFLLDVALVALIGRSGKECRKGMWELDRAFERTKTPAPLTMGPSAQGCEDARLLLRARCGVCRSRCKEPLT
jgi:hypothetical protein